MAGDLRYTAEKYRTALIILVGHGSLRERLQSAYTDSAERAHPPQGGLGPPIPEDLVDQINAFHERIGGPGAAAVDDMDDHEVDQVAEALVYLTIELERALALAGDDD